MKRFLIIAIPAAFLSIMLSSCETETCKDCHIVTYEDGVQISEGSDASYCGANLESVDGQTSTVGNQTTVMVCQ
jgi:hypothetical protein